MYSEKCVFRQFHHRGNIRVYITHTKTVTKSLGCVILWDHFVYVASCDEAELHGT